MVDDARDQAADDAAWQDLVRRLEEAPEGPGETPDGREGSAVAGGGPPEQTAREAADYFGAPVGPLAGPPAGPRDYEVAGDDEGFVAGEPPPLGAGDPLTVLAWCAAAGAPVALLLLALFWRSAPGVVWGGLGLAFLAGVGLLFWRMPRERRDDDGAQV